MAFVMCTVHELRRPNLPQNGQETPAQRRLQPAESQASTPVGPPVVRACGANLAAISGIFFTTSWRFMRQVRTCACAREAAGYSRFPTLPEPPADERPPVSRLFARESASNGIETVGNTDRTPMRACEDRAD